MLKASRRVVRVVRWSAKYQAHQVSIISERDGRRSRFRLTLSKNASGLNMLSVNLNLSSPNCAPYPSGNSYILLGLLLASLPRVSQVEINQFCVYLDVCRPDRHGIVHNSLWRISSDHDLRTPFPPPIDNLVRPVRLPTVRRLVHPSLIPLDLRRLAQPDGFTRFDQVVRKERSRRVGVFEESLDLRV